MEKHFLITECIVYILSGVEDGTTLSYSIEQGDGQIAGDRWIISIGRKDENDLCLRNDTYISRKHANLIWQDDQWWLQDLNSTNGSFVEDEDNFFEDIPVKGTIPIEESQFFRIGRTWLTILTR